VIANADSRTVDVVVIDDKPHALKQIIYEFPGVSKNHVVFRHFDSIVAFREAGLEEPFVIFLDFFLSRDRDYGTSLIPELKCEHLVCFSSKQEMSDHMKQAVDSDTSNRIGNAYSIQKLKATIGNPALREVLHEIFGGT
jgi:hypothetical protein